jgi:organic hydroperoxide reductase OsmC/OhrA
MSDPHRDVTIRLRRTDGYKFEVAYADPAATRIQIDEPPPLGEGQGPNPSQVLASAVAGCLGASLLFCLGKRDAAVDSMQVEAKVTTGRNDQNRLRIQGIRVELRPGVGEDAREALEKCKRVWHRRPPRSRPSPRRPPSMRSASTTSSGARIDESGGDQIFFQGHASPGHLRPRLPRGPADRGAAPQLPPRAARAAASRPTRTPG